MKIISKYYDFYDSCGPYDETEPVYVRTPQYFSSEEGYRYNSKHTKDSVEDRFPEFLQYMDLAFSDYSSKYRWFRPYMPVVYYVGIYPNVYAVPLHCRYLERHESLKGPQDIVTYIPKDSKEAELFEKPKEVPKAFYAIKAPVFIFSPTNIIFDKKHQKPWKDLEPVSLIVNPVLQNITPGVLDKINLDPLKVYNDIENFLWSVKQEPISEPSNTTKILSAGFDLKTSFRNVK